MMDDASPDAAPRQPISALFSQLVDDTTAYVRAEVALYRAQAGRKALSAGVAVAFFGGAIVLAMGAIIALLVGLVIALSHVLDNIWVAIAVVVLGSLALAAMLGWLGYAKVRNLLTPKDDA